MRKATVEEIRGIQLKLLSELDLFCRANNIQYFAFAGTMLGTIRHKGFIPWDNDIDVAVSREDYKRMQVLLKGEDAHPYFRFLCFENDPDYLWQFGKICAKHTFLKTTRGYSKLGLFLDVFPLDSQGDNRKAAERNLRKAQRCVQMRIMAYDKKYKTMKYPPKSSFWDRMRIWFNFNVLQRNTEEYWVSRHIRLAQKFDKISNSVYYGCNSNEKYAVVCKRSMYEGVEYLPFENQMIPVPSGYDDILKLYYGDYMKLPPKEKQIGVKEMPIYIIE